jgi:hypothetical protein
MEDLLLELCFDEKTAHRQQIGSAPSCEGDITSLMPPDGPLIFFQTQTSTAYRDIRL